MLIVVTMPMLDERVYFVENLPGHYVEDIRELIEVTKSFADNTIISLLFITAAITRQPFQIYAARRTLQS